MKKLLLIAALLFSGLANAVVVAPTLPLVDNIYYVSTAAKGGNNSNPCTKTRPCLTVAGAAAKVTKAGSTIHVNTSQGVFTETTQINISPGVSVECDGVVNNSIRAGAGGILFYLNSNQGTLGNQEIRNCKLDGNSLTGGQAIIVGGRSYVSLHDLNIVDFNSYGVKFNGDNDTLGYELAPSTFAVGNKFYNSTITNSASAGQGNLNYGGQDGILIYNNYIDVGRRTSDSNSGYGIKYYRGGFNKNDKIFNNTILKPYPDTGVTYRFAIENWGSLGGTEIYNNIIQGVIDIVHAGKGVSKYSVDIHHNTFGYDTLVTLNNGIAMPAITIEDNSGDVLVRSNYAKNLGDYQALVFVFSANNEQSIRNIEITNNIIYNSRLFTNAVGRKVPLANVKINHNSTYGGGNGGGVVRAIDLGTGRLSNFQIADNIFHTCTTAVSYYIPSVSTDFLDQIDISNNIYYNCGAIYTDLVIANALKPSNMTIANNLNVDPLYRNTSTSVVNAGSFVVGTWYTITSAGTTNFISIGASGNSIGLEFKATGVGSGTGTATPVLDMRLKNTYMNPSDGVDSPARYAGKDTGIYEDFAGYMRGALPDIGALEVPHGQNPILINKPAP